MKYLFVVVDQNDADYCSQLSPIDDVQLLRTMPVIEALRNFVPYKGKSQSGTEFTHRHNFPHGEYSPREDLGEKSVFELYPDIVDELEWFIEEFLPACNNIHTVIHIRILDVKAEDTLYDLDK